MEIFENLYHDLSLSPLIFVYAEIGDIDFVECRTGSSVGESPMSLSPKG
jgi:hypothetical protein